MKKVLFILILFFSCYLIYNKTIDNKKHFLTIGDSLSKGINEYGVISYGYNNYIKDYLLSNNKLREYNNTFTSSDYRIKDIIEILKYNEIKNNYSLIRLIKQADIITISLGMNEIYSKLEKDNSNIYTYIDNMINDYDKILSKVSSFHHDKVYILGYYNITGKNEDIFNYANYKIKELCNKYHYTYVDLSNILDNNPKYIVNKNSFIPNREGYQKISQIIVENLENN